MLGYLIAFLGMGVGAAGVFYGLLLLAVARLKSVPSLPPCLDPTTTGQDVTVVIAARNEARNLGASLESLLHQEAVAQVIVVDDHSEDETLVVAQRLAAMESRVHVLSGPAPPASWVGKSFALQCGAREATTSFILFADADVVFGPGVIGDGVSRMKALQLDHLSGHFCVDCCTVAEEICALFLVLTSSLALFNTSKSVGAGTGAFNMVRSSVYWECGGHEPIKHEIVDDVALARHLKRSGSRSEFLFLADRVKVRLFVGFRGFAQAVFRSSAPFLKWGPSAVALGTAGLAVLIVLTLVGVLLPFFASAVYSHQSHSFGLVFAAGFIPYLFGVLCVLGVRRYANARAVFSLCYPVAALVMSYSLFRSAFCCLSGKPLTWRGRDYVRGLNSLDRAEPTNLNDYSR